MAFAVAMLIGFSSVEAGRLVVRDDDPDSIELNSTAERNQSDMGVYSNTFVKDGKSITKLNQEEDDRKNGDYSDPQKAINDIST